MYGVLLYYNVYTMVQQLKKHTKYKCIFCLVPGTGSKYMVQKCCCLTVFVPADFRVFFLYIWIVNVQKSRECVSQACCCCSLIVVYVVAGVLTGAEREKEQERGGETTTKKGRDRYFLWEGGGNRDKRHAVCVREKTDRDRETDSVCVRKTDKRQRQTVMCVCSTERESERIVGCLWWWGKAKILLYRTSPQRAG